MHVTFNKRENPFYGMSNCLQLLQASGNNCNFADSLLNNAYRECYTEEKKKMFYSLLFSIGDITARNHNIFNGAAIDTGGNSNRAGFETVVKWLWEYQRIQFVKFLNAGLFNEYVGFDILFKNRVQTEKGKIISIFNAFGDKVYCKYLAEYLYIVIKGNNPFNKMLIAKFLTIPRLGKRSKHEHIKSETLKIMRDKEKFIKMLSDLVGWDYKITPKYINFKGYRKWRKQYNRNLESVLFSSWKIFEFDKTSFIEWLDKLPALARKRVELRIKYCTEEEKTKRYRNLREWYEAWESYKYQRQQEQRELEEKVRQNIASEEDKMKLEKVKKDAEVNIGATNFNLLYKDIVNGTTDALKVESFINKVSLPYNSLVFIDDSGSMTGEPFNFAIFIAACCLYKNPDDDARNLIGVFDWDARLYSYISKKKKRINKILKGSSIKAANSPLIDPAKSFYDNYKNLDEFLHGIFEGGGTNIASIPDTLNNIYQNNSQMLDALKKYPVWTIISDGEWNNMPSPRESIKEFMDKCEKYFGYKPFIVAIDIFANEYKRYSQIYYRSFDGIENMVYIPSNLALIEQFLTNFKDMDTFDSYTPLLSLYRSNRYSLVRDNVISSS